MRNRTGAAVPQSITDLVSNTLAKSNAARDRKKQKGNATAFAKIWEDAFRTAYPEEAFFTWRVAEAAAFKRALQRGTIPAPVLPDFINFVVSEFPSTVSERFAWMRTPPITPNVAFVTKHVEVFYQAFLDKDDPNRKVRGHIRRTGPATPTAPVADPAEVEALKKQLAEEKARRERAEKVANDAKAKAAETKRLEAKRLVRKRPTRSEEFGDWDE